MASRTDKLPSEDETHLTCRLLLHGEGSSLHKAPAAALDAVSSKRLRYETDASSKSLGAVPVFVASDSGEPLSHPEETMSKRRRVGNACSELQQEEAEPCSMVPGPSGATAPSCLPEGAPEREGTAMHHREGKGRPVEREAGAGERREAGGQGGCHELMHVLAVDDSPVDRKLVERLLKNVPYKVTTAESGVHALGVLGLDHTKAEPCERGEGSDKVPPNFDLIMTDYSMPGINGYQLLQRLKREETGLERVPVVIMSSDNFPRRVAKCIEGGAEEYLHKPVQAADISRINAQILSRKGSRSPSSSKDEPRFPCLPPRAQESDSKPT